MKKIILVMLICLLAFTCVVSADELNESPVENETPLTDDVPPVIPYRYSEQYEQDVEQWYQHYKPLLSVPNLRSQIYSVLMDNSLSWDDKQAVIKPLMGWDFRLEYYMDESTHTVDEETGLLTYDLGIGNWFANLFGNGVDESLLPQTIAEGDGLYRVYCDNYEEYVQALHDAGDP